MGNPVQRVFISSTTQDLGSYRNAVKEELLTAKIFPVSQTNFGPDYRNLKEFLQYEISQCDAVFCLVGFAYGTAPLYEENDKRSYAQLEYDYAIAENKPVFIFIADKSYIPDIIVHESDEEKEMQESYRIRLMSSQHKWELFSDIYDLKVKVAHACSKIKGPPDATPIFYRHLPRKPMYFAGRTREMQQLEEAITDRTPSIIVVMGMGGQGKTTLVHKVLRDIKDFSFSSGFCCTAYRGGFTFEMFLDEVLKHFLKDDFDKFNLPDLNSRITKLIGFIQQRQVLIVIDGIERWLTGWNSGTIDPQFVDTVHERSSYFEGLDEFLFQISSLDNGTHLIITTRALPAVLDQAERKHIPVIKEDGEIMNLEGIDPVASVDLLKKLGVKGTPDKLKEVAELYANHPLALTVLGTLLKKKFGGYLHSVKVLNPNHELHVLLDEIRESLPGREGAELFLKVVSQCIENPSLEIISEGIKGISRFSDNTLENLLEKAVMLADWNLIWWNGVEHSVSLHPILKNYFSSLLTENESKSIHKLLSQWYSNQLIPENVNLLEEVKSRVLAIKHSGMAGDLDLVEKLLFSPMIEGYTLFTWLGAWGHQLTAIDLLDQFINTQENELQSIFLLGLAQMYQQLARSQLAMEKVDKAIAILKELRISGLLQSPTNLVNALAIKGNLCREIGSSAEAIENFNRAIEYTVESDCNIIDKGIVYAKTLVNRANALRATGALSLAKLDLDSACDIWTQLAQENPKLGELLFPPALTNRGILFLDMGNLNQAIADFEKSIAISKQHHSNYDQEVKKNSAHAKTMLGISFMKSGQYERAVKYATEAVFEFKKLSDEGRTDAAHLLALSLVNRAEVYIALKRWQDALHDCDESTLIYTRLITDAGFHFLGALAHAYCVRGLARYGLGDRNSSEEDRRKGFTIIKQLISEWSKEEEIRIEFIRIGSTTANYLFPDDKEEGIILINELLNEMDRAFLQEESSEWLRNEVFQSIHVLENILPEIAATGYNKSRIQEMIEKARLFNA
jgi:tetratricopeptide (TPR) repeat protein